MNIIRSVFLGISITPFLTTAHAVNAQPPSKEELKDLSSSFFYYPSDKEVFENIEQRYRHPDGIRNPYDPYGNYFQYEKGKPSKNAVEYNKGFKNGIGYFSGWMTMDSTGFDTKKFYKETSQRSKAYQLGVAVAYQIYALHRFEVKHAVSGSPTLGQKSTEPQSVDANRITGEEIKMMDESTLASPSQKELIEIIGKKYRRPDGKYYLHGNYDSYTKDFEPQPSAEFNEAFNEGMKDFLFTIPMDSAGSSTKKFLKNSSKGSKVHQLGIAVAYEIYALHRFEVEQANAVDAKQLPTVSDMPRGGHKSLWP